MSFKLHIEMWTQGVITVPVIGTTEKLLVWVGTPPFCKSLYTPPHSVFSTYGQVFRMYPVRTSARTSSSRNQSCHLPYVLQDSVLNLCIHDKRSLASSRSDRDFVGHGCYRTWSQAFSTRPSAARLSVIYKVVQIWPGLFVCKQVTVCPGHIWTTLYFHFCVFILYY
jgi:hypothetical protein